MFDGSLQMELLRSGAESDSCLGPVPVSFYLRYLPVSEAGMVNLRSDIEGLRHNGIRSALLAKPGYYSGRNESHRQT